MHAVIPESVELKFLMNGKSKRKSKSIPLKHYFASLKWPTIPETNSSPLKIDGWKLEYYFPIGV